MFRNAESRITMLAAEWWRAMQAGNTPGLSDQEAERYFDTADTIAAGLAELPATDASEIAAKVLIWAHEYRITGEPQPGTDVYALMSSMLADVIGFAGPRLELLAEDVIYDVDHADAPNTPENRQRSVFDTLH